MNISMQLLEKFSFKIFNLTFLLGFSLFFVNEWADKAFKLPVAELVACGYIIYAWTQKDNAVSKSYMSMSGLIGTGLLIFWVAIATIVQHLPLDFLVREEIKTITLFIPALLLPLLSDTQRRIFFNLMLGLMCGFIAYFTSLCVTSFLGGGIHWSLKNQQPNPSIMLAILLMLWPYLSRYMKWYLLVGLIFTVFMGTVLGSRGVLLSLAIAALFWLVGKLFSSKPSIISLFFIVGLSVHIVMGFFTDSMFMRVLDKDVATVSNMERAYLIDFSIQEIIHSPWVGIGRREFTNTFGYSFDDMYQEVGRVIGSVESPHNTFLEIAVFYGVPALVFMAIALFATTRFALQVSGFNIAMVAFTLSLLVRHGALYGFSGHYRIELLVMWAVVYLSIKPVSLKKTDTPRIKV